MPEQPSSRRRINSAHVISLVALFIALGTGAYAASNTVGAKQIKEGAVRASEIRDGTITAVELAKGAITGDSIQGGAITTPKIAKGAVTTDAIQDGAVTAAKEADDAKSTLFTDVNDGPVNVSTAAAATVGTLNLPAGSYLVVAGASAVHNDATKTTRLECSISAGTTVIDAAKERLAANDVASALIFTKQELAGPTTLAIAGTVTYNCSSTNNTSIDLTSVRLMAMRVSSIVAQ